MIFVCNMRFMTNDIQSYEMVIFPKQNDFCLYDQWKKKHGNAKAM